jgi:hypothetical protein
MKSKISLTFKFFIFFIATMAFFGGRLAMSDQDIEIKWEWPAGRQIETKLLINIKKISKASTGFFGIGASPSLANALPDATDVVASVIFGQENLIGKTISMRMPGVEANKLKVGEPAAVALVSNNICICVSAAPRDTHDLEDWFQKWSC